MPLRPRPASPPVTADQQPKRQWPAPDIRRLPRPLKPLPDETTFSYLSRLSLAHRWPLEELLCYLCPNTWPEERSPSLHTRYNLHHLPQPELPSLSAATGLSMTALAYALPEIRDQHPERRHLKVKYRNVAGNANEARSPCRRCTAAKGITENVTTWMRHDQNVCLRHGIWIGPGAYTKRSQVDVNPATAIITAQRRHTALINKLRRRWVRAVTPFAFAFLGHWTRWGDPENHAAQRLVRIGGNQRRRTFGEADPYLSAAQYPEVVSLIEVLAARRTRLLHIVHDETERLDLTSDIQQRVIPHYTDDRSRYDPFSQWIHDLGGLSRVSYSEFGDFVTDHLHVVEVEQEVLR